MPYHVDLVRNVQLRLYLCSAKQPIFPRGWETVIFLCYRALLNADTPCGHTQQDLKAQRRHCRSAGAASCGCLPLRGLHCSRPPQSLLVSVRSTANERDGQGLKERAGVESCRSVWRSWPMHPMLHRASGSCRCMVWVQQPACCLNYAVKCRAAFLAASCLPHFSCSFTCRCTP